MTDIGRLLIVIGGSLLVLGLVLVLAGRIPGLGQLPGDIRIQRDNFTFYAPLGTMLLLSVLLTILLNVLARWWR
ncbi:MAG TPA: DUF2905 domain-containing protein [Caldilineaceae bacterium]|nr:DUF2905 domain-containing protein [Caldilineaceae bacterium]